MSAPAPVQVRGHHLLCLLTYVGEGYSKDFVRAMDALAHHVAGENPVRLCVGPDILCSSLEGADTVCQGHCSLARNVERDHVAFEAVGQLLGRVLRAGDITVLTSHEIATMRQAVQSCDAQQTLVGLRAACRGCEWLELCRQVSQAGFSHARIKGRTA